MTDIRSNQTKSSNCVLNISGIRLMTIMVSIKQSYAMLAVERSVSFSIIENNLCRSIFISRGLPSPFSPSGDSRFRTKTITQLNHIKKRGNLKPSLIPLSRLSHCLASEDKQCRSPRCCILNELWTIRLARMRKSCPCREYTIPWALNIALSCGCLLNLRDSDSRR